MTDALRVLIVDDTPDIRMLLKTALGLAKGIEPVGEAGDGEEAVRMAADLQPDAVLLDLAMPVMDGLQATPEIRKVSPHTRIIILSGFSKDRLGPEALAAGADEYIEKGTSPMTIAEIIREVCETPRSSDESQRPVEDPPPPPGGTGADDGGDPTSWRKRIALAVEHVGELTSAFASFTRTVRARVPVDRAGYALSEASGFRLAAAVGPTGQLARPIGTLLTVPGPISASLDRGATIMVDDTESQAHEPFDVELFGKGVRSYAAVPVRVAGKARAMVSFASDRPNVFHQNVDYLEEAVREAAAAFYALWCLGQHGSIPAGGVNMTDAMREWNRIVRHDLRSPLTVISGFAETMRVAWADIEDGKKLEFVEAISRGANAMQTLLTDMEDVDRIETGVGSVEPRPIRLCELIAQTTKDLTAGRDREITITIPDDLPLALADEHDQRRVLHNLIENAFKFSLPDQPVEVNVAAVDGMIRVSVTDHGVGIAPQDQDRMFEKFSRSEITAPSVRGTGLGLYICRSIVEAHGGRIWIESEPGVGTTIHYTIPAASVPV